MKIKNYFLAALLVGSYLFLLFVIYAQLVGRPCHSTAPEVVCDFSVSAARP